MGNQSFKCGNIYIQTDKPYYQAGDTVTGHVYLNILNMFPGKEIYLKVKGYEACKWNEYRTKHENLQNSDGSTTLQQVGYWEHFEGKKSFYSHKFTLNEWGIGNIPIGQYSLPFSFQLQSHLPGSFQEEGKNSVSGINEKEHWKAEIIYKIKAETSAPKGYEKMKHKQEIIVREPMKQISQQQTGQMIKNAKTWCCIDQGQSTIKCYFESNNYQPGETAQVITEIDNSNCQLDIKEVKGQLIQTINLESKSHSKTIVKVIQSQAFGSIGAGQKKCNEQSIRTPIELICNSKPIQPSTKGNLVKSQYSLKIQAQLDGVICCSDDPNVVVPIQLLAPPSSYGVIQQPSDWNPQLLEAQNFIFSSSNMYAKGDLSINMSVGNMNQPPSMNLPPQNVNATFNQPPQNPMHIQQNQNNNAQGFQGINMNVKQDNNQNIPSGYQENINYNINMSDPAQQGFNQPKQEIMNINLKVSDQGFNQPQTGQQGFNQSQTGQQIFNQPPGGNLSMNVGFQGDNMNFNIKSNDTSTTGFNLNPM